MKINHVFIEKLEYPLYIWLNCLLLLTGVGKFGKLLPGDYGQN
jgi:hypothetical protein